MEVSGRESRESVWRTLWARNVAAAKANLVPGLILQAVGLLVVLLYYYFEPAKSVFMSVAGFKEQHGYVYSGIATVIFGGLIPCIVHLLTGQVPSGMIRAYALFSIFFWLWRGIEVDAFYRLQAVMFGSEASATVVIKKVLVDQFVYCVLWASPVCAFFYSWRDHRFSWRSYRVTHDAKSFLVEVMSFLVATWMVWIPATAIIYSLPSPLQIPLFNLALCFFVLLMSVLGDRSQHRKNH